MKKIKYILILLLLFSIHTINAQQEYKRCLDGDVVKWSVFHEMIDSAPMSIEIAAYGDTVINGIIYKNILADYLYNFDSEESNTNWKNYIPDSSYYRFTDFRIRESNDASQLYILAIRNGKEYLISDLNLQVGDEFRIPEIWNVYSFDEDRLVVDSVYIENGLKHVRLDYIFDISDYIFDSSSGYIFYNSLRPFKLTFIEGVGPNIGFFSLEMLYQIVNCFQNQSLFYKNELISIPCGYNKGGGGGIETVFSNKDYSLLSKDEGIVIDFPSEEIRQISICDISGRLHYNRDFLTTKEVLIPTGSFPKGIYLLKIFNKKENRISINKIIL
jgi:hypothetical protein